MLPSDAKADIFEVLVFRSFAMAVASSFNSLSIHDDVTVIRHAVAGRNQLPEHRRESNDSRRRPRYSPDALRFEPGDD